MGCRYTQRWPQVTHLGHVGIGSPMRVIAMSKRWGQSRQDTLIQVAGDGTYSRCPTTPLKNGIQAYLLHIVRLNPDSAI